MLSHRKVVLIGFEMNGYKAEYVSNWYTHEQITKFPIKQIIPTYFHIDEDFEIIAV